MASSTASPLEIQSALRHSFRLPTTGLRSSPVSDNSHGGRSPRVIRFGDEVDDSDLEMTDSDCDNDKKEQAWVREMLQELVSFLPRLSPVSISCCAVTDCLPVSARDKPGC